MFQISIAELVIQIVNKYDDVQQLCRQYLVQDGKPDLIVSVSEEEIRIEAEQSEVQGYSRGYLESVCMYRKICEQLPRFDAFLLHASVLSVDAVGYAFLGHSGVGKTTQTKLWLNYFHDRAFVVNGDKPILRGKREGKYMRWYAYGTPWCGKEGLQRNTKVLLHAFCFLEQATKNQINRLPEEEFVDRFFHQCLLPKEIDVLDRFLTICDHVVQTIPAWLLSCRPDTEAVQLAWEAFGI